VQGGLLNQPIYYSNVSATGYPGILTDGVDDVLQSILNANLQNGGTMFAVIMLLDDANSTQFMQVGGGNATLGWATIHMRAHANSRFGKYANTANASQSITYTSSTNNFWLLDVLTLAEVNDLGGAAADADQLEILDKGTPSGLAKPGLDGTRVNAPLWLGGGPNTTNVLTPGPMALVEVRIYDGILAPGDRATVRASIMQKYGLS
jgi:hypothetical protein